MIPRYTGFPKRSVSSLSGGGVDPLREEAGAVGDGGGDASSPDVLETQSDRGGLRRLSAASGEGAGAVPRYPESGCACLLLFGMTAQETSSALQIDVVASLSCFPHPGSSVVLDFAFSCPFFLIFRRAFSSFPYLLRRLIELFKIRIQAHAPLRLRREHIGVLPGSRILFAVSQDLGIGR